MQFIDEQSTVEAYTRPIPDGLIQLRRESKSQWVLRMIRAWLCRGKGISSAPAEMSKSVNFAGDSFTPFGGEGGIEG